MAECLKEITLESLWQFEIQEEEECYINDRVVPLNNLVREWYLKYLREVLTKNLNMCSDSSNLFTQHDIERCAGLLELKALRLCMVTSLYQKAMVQMVADIKQHTKESKLFDELQEFVPQNCLCKANKCKATQTSHFEFKLEDQGNIQKDKRNYVHIKTEISDEKEIDHFPFDLVEMPHSSFSTPRDDHFRGSCASQSFLSTTTHLPEVPLSNQHHVTEKEENCEGKAEQNGHTSEIDKNDDGCEKHVQEKDKMFACSTHNDPSNVSNLKNCNKNVNDTKCSKNCTVNTEVSTEQEDAMKQLHSFLNDETSEAEFGEAFLYDTATEELIRILESEDELGEEDASNNISLVGKCEKSVEIPLKCADTSAGAFWKTEKKFQEENLHDHIAKMCCNPEAKIKMKNKFFDIFGFDSDEDDVWCSKEKIAKYKQRIAPLVVKQLLPYYRQKRILGRSVFKRVASHITDKLVSVSHFPEEADIEKGITLFFSYHGFIGKPEDVWTGWDRELH